MRKFLIACLGCLFTAPAFAHAFLDVASPRVGSEVTPPPTEISLTYTEAVEPGFCHIDLFDGAGNPVALGTATRSASDDKTLISAIPTKLPPGHYEVRWNVLSVDTHRTNGHFTFDVLP